MACVKNTLSGENLPVLCKRSQAKSAFFKLHIVEANLHIVEGSFLLIAGNAWKNKPE